MKKPTQSAFTLIEVTVVVAILGLILAFAVPAVVSALRGSQATGDEAALKTLNEAAIRAKLKDMLGPGTIGSDKVAALDWYLDQNLIQNTKRPDISKLSYSFGQWGETQWDSIDTFKSEFLYSPQEHQDYLARDWGYADMAEMLVDVGQPNVEAMATSWGYDNFYNMATDYGYPDVNLDKIMNTPGAVEYLANNMSEFTNAQIEGLIFPRGPNLFSHEQYLSLFEAVKKNPNANSGTAFGMLDELGRTYPTTYGLIDVSDLDFSAGTLFGSNYNKTNITVAQLNSVPTGALFQGNFEGIDLTGLNLNGRSIGGARFAGTGITGLQLNQATQLNGTKLNGLNLAGLNMSGKSMTSSDLTGVTGITGSAFNGAISIAGSKFTGVDMSGFTPGNTRVAYANYSGTTNFTGSMLNSTDQTKNYMNVSGLNLTGANFSGATITGTNFTNASNLTAQNIASAASINNINLSGTGITKAALNEALTNAGKNPNSGHFNTNSITF